MTTYHEAAFNVTQAWDAVGLPSYSFALDTKLVKEASDKLITQFLDNYSNFVDLMHKRDSKLPA